MTTNDPHHEPDGQPAKSTGSAAAEPAQKHPPLSPDSMNTYVERHRDGSWCVWTAADGGDRVVSRHSTREQALQAQVTIRGGHERDLEA